jgi:hypothetical protein
MRHWRKAAEVIILSWGNRSGTVGMKHEWLEIFSFKKSKHIELTTVNNLTNSWLLFLKFSQSSLVLFVITITNRKCSDYKNNKIKYLCYFPKLSIVLKYISSFYKNNTDSTISFRLNNTSYYFIFLFTHI